MSVHKIVPVPIIGKNSKGSMGSLSGKPDQRQSVANQGSLLCQETRSGSIRCVPLREYAYKKVQQFRSGFS